MQTYTYKLGGSEVTINFPETDADLGGFREFLSRGDKILGFDTEGTGLDTYSQGHAVRLVQFGNDREAWVLRVDRFREEIRAALSQPRHFVAHNAPFDLLEVDAHLGIPLEELGPKMFDTKVLAHLDNSSRDLGLKKLSAEYIDPDAPDTQADLTEVFRKEYKATKDTGWAVIDIDHPTYVLYAGLDPILAHRLFSELAPAVKSKGLGALARFEHRLQLCLARMQRRGLRIDTDYVERLRADLEREESEGLATAARYGVENVNSTRQIAEALIGMGETLREKTPSGAWKVDKEILLPLADMSLDWQRHGNRDPNPLADAVLHGKRAGKWLKSYVEPFQTLLDSDSRIHPMINGLQARTARMSVSRPPLQQLPSGDWKVRRAVVADPGHLLVASDYSQVEMRVLAALAEESAMIAGIREGRKIHDIVATMMFGEGYSKHQYKLAKNTGFGEVFGGGAATLARQAGVDLSVAQDAKRIFAEGFPGIKKFGKQLQRRAEFGRREVVTPTGRRLPLDRDRTYAATNYICQSTARDVIAQAILDIHDAGMGDYLLLPVHDELVAQAPEADAADVAAEIGRLMEREFRGVPITSEHEILGPSWGSGYGCPPELDVQS